MLYVGINNSNKKGIFDSFQEISTSQFYPNSLNHYENLMDFYFFFNILKIILLGAFSFHINIMC